MERESTGANQRFYKAEKECNERYQDIFFRKHCVIASYLEHQMDSKDHAFVFDADVVIKTPPWIADARPITTDNAATGFSEKNDGGA